MIDFGIKRQKQNRNLEMHKLVERHMNSPPSRHHKKLWGPADIGLGRHTMF